MGHPFYLKVKINFGRAIKLNQQIESAAFMKENHIQIQSWALFAEGRNDLFQNEVLVSIAKKVNKSVAQVVLRW
jgi:diketogulonate reductase-like aldo/keto reductase